MGSSSAQGSTSPQGQAQLVKMLLPTWLSPGFNTPRGLAEVPTSRDSPSFPTCLCQPRAEPTSKPIAQSPTFQKRFFFHLGWLCRDTLPQLQLQKTTCSSGWCLGSAEALPAGLTSSCGSVKRCPGLVSPLSRLKGRKCSECGNS